MIRNVRRASVSLTSSTVRTPWAVRYLPVPPVIANRDVEGPASVNVSSPLNRDLTPGQFRGGDELEADGHHRLQAHECADPPGDADLLTASEEIIREDELIAQAVSRLAKIEVGLLNGDGGDADYLDVIVVCGPAGRRCGGRRGKTENREQNDDDRAESEFPLHSSSALERHSGPEGRLPLGRASEWRAAGRVP